MLQALLRAPRSGRAAVAATAASLGLGMGMGGRGHGNGVGRGILGGSLVHAEPAHGASSSSSSSTSDGDGPTGPSTDWFSSLKERLREAIPVDSSSPSAPPSSSSSSTATKGGTKGGTEYASKMSSSRRGGVPARDPTGLGLGRLRDLARKVELFARGTSGSGSAEDAAELIRMARESASASSFVEQQSFSEMLHLVREQLARLDKSLKGAFGNLGDLGDMELSSVAVDPTALFYFLEREDETKTPSWKRRAHRFMPGVDEAEMDRLYDALFFADVAYLDSAQEVEQALGEARGEARLKLVHSCLEGRPGEPAHFVAIDTAPRARGEPVTVLVGVRGTKSLGDVFTDGMLEPVEYAGGLAHAGMLEAAGWLVARHRQLLRDIRAGGDEVRVELVGHSMGASCAVLAALLLQQEQELEQQQQQQQQQLQQLQVRVVGFGCPALLSKELAERCRPFVTTVVNDADMVPRCSAATLANLALDVRELDYSGQVLRDVRQAVGEMCALSPVPVSEADAEAAVAMVADAVHSYVGPRIAPASARRAPPRLFPPGTCMHIYRDGRGLSCAYVPCDFFGELDVSRTMLDDHLISGYDKAFAEILRDYGPGTGATSA